MRKLVLTAALGLTFAMNGGAAGLTTQQSPASVALQSYDAKGFQGHPTEEVRMDTSAIIRSLGGAVVALLFSTTPLAGMGQEPGIVPRAIFGDDDRHERHAILDPGLRMMADAVVLLVDNWDLHCDASGTACDLSSATPLFDGRACTDEPFATQPTAGFCTGFLIASDLVATAGHCIDELTCPFTAFVFGFGITAPEGNANTVNLQTYRCAEVVESVSGYGFENDGSFQGGADYALVRLDRLVNDRTPLAVRREPAVAVADQLVVMGHPFGLPLKIADGAAVKSTATTFFEADLDASGGNSGSPVLDRKSLEAVGILVRGGGTGGGVIDFEQGCLRSPRYNDVDGYLGGFPQITNVAMLPVVESCVGRPDCFSSARTASCLPSASSGLRFHRPSCRECYSDRGPARTVRRNVEKTLRLLLKGHRAFIDFDLRRAEKALRQALRNLDRTGLQLEQLSARSRISWPCHGALRSVINEVLDVAHLDLALVAVLK